LLECPRCGHCAADSADACPFDGIALSPTLNGPPVLDGKYQLEQCLGKGGMGAVYKARHLDLDRLFALKLVLPDHAVDSTYQAFFRNEALALGRLRHPGVVGVTDFGVDPRDGGVPYLVMDYLEGENLDQLLRKEGPLPFAKTLPILQQIAHAVDAAHRIGVLHRDLKPANILISTGPGGDLAARVLDFGLAQLKEGPQGAAQPRPLVQDTGGSPRVKPSPFNTVPLADPPPPAGGENATVPLRGLLDGPDGASGWAQAQEVVGTPGYMAPEIFTSRKGTPAADVYAFGMMAYEMLVGRLPFEGSLTQVLDAHAQTAPPRPTELNPKLPAELEPALLAPLAKDPRLRPDSLGAMAAGLQRAWAESQLHAWERRELPRRRASAALAALAGLALAWVLPLLSPIQALEGRLEDIRTALAPPRSADPRIVLVSLDESTLDDGTANFFERADRLVQGVDDLLRAGPAAVSVDLLLPRRYSESESLSRLVLEHRQRLVMALYAPPNGRLLGWECLSDLTRAALGDPAQLQALFGLVNLEPDGDGRIRRFRTAVSAEDGTTLAPMAVRMARLAGQASPAAKEILVDHSVDPGTLARMAWKDVSARLATEPGYFKDRLVLIGVDSSTQEDVHAIPAIRGRPGELAGMAIHGLMLQSLLEERPTHTAPAWLPALLSLAVMGACAWGLLRFHRIWVAWATVAGVLATGATAGLLTGMYGLMLPLAGPTVATLLLITCSALARRLLPPIPAPLPDLEPVHAP